MVKILSSGCNTCALSCCYTVWYWQGPRGHTSSTTKKCCGAEGVNNAYQVR